MCAFMTIHLICLNLEYSTVCVKISICDYKDYESTAVETSSGWFSRGYAALTYLLTQYSFLCVRLVVIVIVISFPP